MTPTELWLPLGAIAFQLYDATQALWHNEVLFERAGARWHIRANSTLRRWGRRFVLPNPLLPQRPIFRAAWSIDDTRPASDVDLAPFLTALRPLGFACQLLLFMLLALWPLCWLLGAGLTVLALFAAYYLLVIGTLILIFCRRTRLALTNRAYWNLAFEVLACAPFAVNIVRKLSIRHNVIGNPVEFAAQRFDAQSRRALAMLIRDRLEESRAGEPPAQGEEAGIAKWLAKLETAAP